MATVQFLNHGPYDLILKKEGTAQEYRISKGVGSSINVDGVSQGDQFNVTNLTEPEFVYPTIYITDVPVDFIRLQGNKPFGKMLHNISNIQNITDLFQSNLFGVDIVNFNPRRVLNSFASGQIFRGLELGSTDWEIQGDKVMKAGMSYSTIPGGEGSSDVRMAYSYSSFAQEWGINLGLKGEIPVKGGKVKPGLDFGFNQFENEERSSQTVYAFTWEQRSVYEISLNPREANLDFGFIDAVRQVSSVADASRNIVEVFGTHYVSKIYYGGERSLFATMNNSTYARAKGFGIDIGLSVAASKDNELKTVKNGNTERASGSTDPSDIASGSLGFSFSQNEQEREILKQSRSGFLAIGGQGGFDSWTVTEDTAAPVAVELQPLGDLIDAEIFKNGTTNAFLSKKKQWIEEAIEQRINAMPTLGQPLPAPRVYSVILKRIEVTDEVDDLDKRTHGSIQATVSPNQPEFDGLLWNATTFDERNLRYHKGSFVTPNSRKVLVQPPEENGTFAPLQLRFDGNIEESDHAGGAERHTGTTDWVTVEPNLGVGQEQSFTMDLSAYTTFAERGTIRVTLAIRRAPSDFIESLAPFNRTQRSQPATPIQRPTERPAPRATLTPITNGNVGNFGGWAATSGVRVLTGDFTGDEKTDIALVNQSSGWGTIPIAHSRGDGNFNITNGAAGDFARWATVSGVRVLTGDFNESGRTDIALVRQGEKWDTVPIAFSNEDGNFTITNGNVGSFGQWAATSGVRIITGDFSGDGITAIALARQEAGWGTIPIAFSNGDGNFTITNSNVGSFAQWAAISGARIVTGDFNGNGRTDIALVRQGEKWDTVPIAFSDGDGNFDITNKNVEEFGLWAAMSGVQIVTGDFNGNGRTDIALVRQGEKWDTVPIAFSNGDGSFEITNGNVGQFGQWAATNGVQLVPGDFNGNGQTDIGLVRQEAGWGTLPIAFAHD